MPRNKIEDLRNHMFATIESLLDEENPMDIDRAKAVAEVGKVIVESAKAEVMYLKVTRSEDTSLFMQNVKQIDQ
jgi:hypothetical protein